MITKNIYRYFVPVAVLVICSINVLCQSVSSDSWSATDALGRKVREYSSSDQKKKDKYVAMFYWTWHQGRAGYSTT